MEPGSRFNRNCMLIACTLFCLATLSPSTQAQQPQSYASTNFNGVERDIPKDLIRKFQRDAARLALRIEAQKQDLSRLSINIPKGNIEVFFNILTQIYMQDETAKAIARCEVHTFPNPSTDQVTVIYDKNVEWAALLRQGLTEKGQSTINDLLERYDLRIEKHLQWNDTQDAIVVRSLEPLNMTALAKEFHALPGVSNVNLDVPTEMGNDIQIERINGGWEVNYIIRFGQMPGESKSHIWTYHAMDDNTIRLANESGAPIPSWLRCDLFSETLIATRF